MSPTFEGADAATCICFSDELFGGLAGKLMVKKTYRRSVPQYKVFEVGKKRLTLIKQE